MARKKKSTEPLPVAAENGTEIDRGIFRETEFPNGMTHAEPSLYTRIVLEANPSSDVEAVLAIKKAMEEIKERWLLQDGGRDAPVIEDGTQAASLISEINDLGKLTEQKASAFLKGMAAGMALMRIEVLPQQAAARKGKQFPTKTAVNTVRDDEIVRLRTEEKLTAAQIGGAPTVVALNGGEKMGKSAVEGVFTRRSITIDK